MMAKYKIGQYLTVNMSVIFTEWDDALGSAATLRTKKDAIQHIVKTIKEILQEEIPEDKACSTVIAHK